MNINIPANVQSISQKETLRMANLLMKALSQLTGVSGYVPNPTGMREAKESANDAERVIRKHSKQVAENVMKFLKDNTPVDTGKARAGWDLHILDLPRGTEYVIFHNNKKLIDMLNYGTKAHGPKNAKVMVFEIGGKTVYTTWVKGIPALGFVDKARALMQAGMQQIATVKA